MGECERFGCVYLDGESGECEAMGSECIGDMCDEYRQCSRCQHEEEENCQDQ